ncbi:Pancreatic progenitor cell differentiation and proliferation factor-like, partial [Balearica regulorum gibbericeps]
MASVPSAGCLLAKNQYYRSKRSGDREGCSGGGRLSFPSRCPGCYCSWKKSESVSGLPDLIDRCWWIKSFFHSEPSPPTVGRKTLSAS